MGKNKLKHIGNQGFSLIELMVAMIIMSSITLIGSSAYALFIKNWDGNVGQAEKLMLESQHYQFLYRVVKSISPYVAISEGENVSLVFNGQIEMIFSAASQGIFTEGKVFFSLQVVGPVGDKKLRYYEKSLSGSTINPFNEEVLWDFEYDLLRNVNDISFQFFGWQSLEHKAQDYIEFSTQNIRSDAQAWYDNYDSAERGLHPDLVVINLVNRDGSFESLEVVLPQKAELFMSRFRDEI